MLDLQRTLGNAAVTRMLNTGMRSTVQRTLILDDQRIGSVDEVLSRTDVAQRLNKVGLENARRVLQTMIEYQTEGFAWTTDQLVERLPQILSLYGTGKELEGDLTPENTPVQKVATLMHMKSLGTKLPGSFTGPGSAYFKVNKADLGDANVAALNKHLEDHPGLMDIINSRRLKIRFNSKAQGVSGLGGMYEIQTNTAHLEAEVTGRSPDHFMRTLLHEIGHGVFQRELLMDELEEVTNKGTVKSDLLSQAEQKKFSEDGMTFFKAWEVLRAGNGKYMFGAALSDKESANATARKAYQAATFAEFCAESFMHVAQEESDLKQHIESLKTDRDVPGAVIAAWDDVWRILSRRKTIIMTRQ